MSKRSITTVVLAAGKGTRMKSRLPKVVHPVCGVPMIAKVLDAAQHAGSEDLRVVVGHGRELVEPIVKFYGGQCFFQIEQRGTADAVRSAEIDSMEGDVCILNGDHPLIRAEDLRNFISDFREQGADISVVTTEVESPGAYGRVVRSGGHLHAIVEAKDATTETLKIKEINTGLYVVRSEALKELLPLIKNQNSQGEFYLTDLISLAIENRKKVVTLKGRPHVAYGVNDQRELAEASRILFRSKAEALMLEGVTIMDPNHTYIEESVLIGPSTVIFPNVYIRGKTKIGSLVTIEPNCFIVDSIIADQTEVRAGSYFESATVAHACKIGPYARLRPETVVGPEVHIGNFVELKKVKMGARSKANHLAYLGDAEIGEDTNIGCGTITCNYATDRKKYVTKIGSHVFVGSDSQFVAPVKIGDHAIIGSGSTITKDVPARALAVARGRQVIKENYVKADEASAAAPPPALPSAASGGKGVSGLNRDQKKD